MPTLKLSEQGKILVENARKKLGWTQKDDRWLIAASKILDPKFDRDALGNYGIYATGVSSATCLRFQKGDNIEESAFKALCEALEPSWNWKEVAQGRKDLSKAPHLSPFYGRTQELQQLENSLIPIGYQLVIIYGVEGIGKSALARQVVEKAADKYDYIIWYALDYPPPFKQFLTDLLLFLSEGHKQECDISLIMAYLRYNRCLIVLDSWQEIIDDKSEDYKGYSAFLERVGKESHKSCLLLLSREKPANIKISDEQCVQFLKLRSLSFEDTREFFNKTEGLSYKESELDYLSRNYSNPWIIKKIAGLIKEEFDGETAELLRIGTIYIDELKFFLDCQFTKILQLEAEKNTIYWIAIRRNSATWEQLATDTNTTLNDTLKVLRPLTERYALVDIRKENRPFQYTLDPVTLKYITNKFVENTCNDFKKVIDNLVIEGSELFITHSLITDNPDNEELTQEQIKRIVKPIHQQLLAKLGSQQRVEQELKKILSLLEDRGFSQGYARQNILTLLSQDNHI
ncbi:NACHT domain-containing protein [Calothrix sp. PCC 7507]|uniref:NACHT domain-containing protein n=1 Tax=Calothrix sp. PCC 7507 TaxID=99598 RepID=UPI00029F3B96|nr:ATP-binding protein [Calothrix sp. PCC 7507]AFY34374.1 hypothetical protein Cal7507_3988 [Calothrix sp. PCC 7507]